MSNPELRHNSESIRLSVGVAVVFSDNDGNYYLFANKKRSKGNPSYRLLGGACKFGNGQVEGNLKQEGSDFRFSGFGSIEEADSFFQSYCNKINPSDDLLREFQEELGDEEIQDLIKLGFNVKGELPDNSLINLLIKQEQQPDTIFFDPEISERTGTKSRRILFLYRSLLGLGREDELFTFIKNNSEALEKLTSITRGNYPLFIKLTPNEIEQIKNGYLGEKNGESYNLRLGSEITISISSQINVF